ncbi:uncharacterized protein [Haliotis cracherodii]|uniref:uncharacterized protein n=1 Tax=Haliotis cracherodii TaxID=6455 RepID=UPI0039ED80E2
MASNCLQAKNVSCADEEEEFVKNIPVVIMFSLFLVVGVFGNIFILCIYGLKFKESTTRVFILSLAVFDLISCVSLPYKITLLRYGSLFSNPNLARLEIVRIYFLQVSVSILPLMSFDRYRRICQPLKVQISPKVAKILVTCVIVIMTICTIVRMVVTSYTNNQCYRAEAFVSAEFVNKTVQVWLQELNFICVILPFILPLPILIVVYTLIGVKVRRLGKTNGSGIEPKQHTPLNISTPRCFASPKSDEDNTAENDVIGAAHGYLKTSSLRHSTSSVKRELWTTGSDSKVRPGHHPSPSSLRLTKTSDERTVRASIKPGTNSPGQTRTGCHRFEMDVQQRNSRLQHIQKPKIRLSRIRTSITSKAKKFSRATGSQSGVEECQSSPGRHSDQPPLDNTPSQYSITPRTISSYASKGDIVTRGTTSGNTDHREDLQESRTPSLENESQQEKAVNDLTLRKHKSAETRLPWKRMTLIFFLITVVYIVSCLPFFTIYVIFRVAPCYGYELLSQGGYIVLYNFVYIITVSNCFLYGFFDPRFKRQLRSVTSSILNRLFRKCRLKETSL